VTVSGCRRSVRIAADDTGDRVATSAGISMEPRGDRCTTLDNFEVGPRVCGFVGQWGRRMSVTHGPGGRLGVRRTRPYPRLRPWVGKSGAASNRRKGLSLPEHRPTVEGDLSDASVSLDPAAGVVMLRPVGGIDLTSRSRVDTAVAVALDRAATTMVILDRSDVGFLESCGIATLIRARMAADRLATAFLVRHALSIVAVLRMTGVWAYLSGQAG